MLQVQLYTTVGCHLCEQAEAMLLPVCVQFNWPVEKVEIADSDALLKQYGVRIPVIAVAGVGGDLGWPFDALQLRKFLLEQADRQVE